MQAAVLYTAIQSVTWTVGGDVTKMTEPTLSAATRLWRNVKTVNGIIHHPLDCPTTAEKLHLQTFVIVTITSPDP